MQLLLVLSILTNFVYAQITFVNPEPSVAGAPRNYQLNPTYVIGSSLLIQWKSPSNSVSMVLYQERKNDEFEYVFTNSVGITSFRWNVGTQKNLTNGAVFFFQIFVTGETGPSASSRYFNLTRGRDDGDSKTSSSITSSTLSVTPTISLTSSVSTSTSVSSGTGVAGAVTPGPPSTTPVPANESEAAKSAIANGTKVGLGVGIPVGILAILALAFFFWRRHKSSKVPKDDYTNTVPPTMDNKYTPPGDGSYAPNAMAEQGGGYYKPAGNPGEATEMFAPGTGKPVTMRSELANTGAPAGNTPNEMYSPPVGSAHTAPGHTNGEVHEMSGVRY